LYIVVEKFTLALNVFFTKTHLSDMMTHYLLPKIERLTERCYFFNISTVVINSLCFRLEELFFLLYACSGVIVSILVRHLACSLHIRTHFVLKLYDLDFYSFRAVVKFFYTTIYNRIVTYLQLLFYYFLQVLILFYVNM
jgi:hypothetical protein